ncbi:MAG: SPOR domain-containing protein [Arcobacteraceae bacterium]
MKVDGNEFLRNVGIEQDKERLTQEQQRLEELKRASVKREQNYMDMDMEANEDDSAFVDLSIGSDAPNNTTAHNGVEDIMLDTSKANNNKKKYIMLGFGLVLLFIITVLVIRLISNNDTQSQLEKVNSVQQPEVTKDDILNKIDSNEEYQKVIDKKNNLNETNAIVEKEKEALTDLEIPQQQAPTNVPLVIDTPKVKVEPKRDLFGLDKEAQKVAPKVVEKVVQPKPKPTVVSKPKKEIVVPPAKETNFTKKATNIDGYFIQIGAFTKDPNKNLLKSIVSKGYSYKVYQLTIKGKLYNKVLIGPFTNRAEATEKLSQVKLDFKNPNAYILKF